MLKRNLKKLSLMLLVSMTTFVSALPAIPALAADSITVDCGSVVRNVTHCASGSLYGMTEAIPADINNLVAPTNPCVMRNPARAGSGNQHSFAAAIPVAGRLSGVTSAKVSVDLADMLPGWPYTWPGMSSWLSQINSFIADKKASGYSNFYGYEIWNEPDGTWLSSNGDFNSYLWKQTYSDIRANDSSAKIIGPCYSYYNHNTMSAFLSYCKSNNCLPDIISWHELSGIQNVANNMKDYRALEASLGISPLPISINEYCDANHNLEGQPGSLASFIGKFERYKVDSACISWWFTQAPGRLGSLLATDTQKGAGWYLMNWYGQMTGSMVNVNVSNDASTNIDGAACVDSSSKYVSCILGGSNTGTVSTTFKNLPSFIGATASVKIEKVDWTSKDTVSNGTNVVSTAKYTVNNGQITVTMTGCNASSGYRIYITPDTGSGIVSGNVYTLTNVMSGLVLDNYNSTVDGNKVGQWTANGNSTQQWKITSVGNGYYTLTNQMSSKNLDNNNTTVNGANVVQWTVNNGSTQLWKIVNVSGNIYTLQSQMSGLDLDNGNSASSGQNVIQYTPNNTSAQQWTIK